jgi:hypothetical protein
MLVDSVLAILYAAAAVVVVDDTCYSILICDTVRLCCIQTAQSSPEWCLTPQSIWCHEIVRVTLYQREAETQSWSRQATT